MVAVNDFCWNHLTTRNFCHGSVHPICNCDGEDSVWLEDMGDGEYVEEAYNPALPPNEYPNGFHSINGYHGPDVGRKRWITGIESDDDDEMKVTVLLSDSTFECACEYNPP